MGFTTLTVLSDSLYVGSKLGSIYSYGVNEFEDLTENSNLVTHITHLNCNKNRDKVLALSKWKANAARVIDGVSGKAIGDWPAAKTKIGFPTKGAFA